MNSYERSAAKLRGMEVDRLPVQPLFMVYAADLIGLKYWEYLQDYRNLVKGQLAVAEKFGMDLVSCCSDAWREAADCGARLKWFDHQPPSCEEHVITGPADLAKLNIPDPEGGGRMTDRLEAIRLFAGQVKGQLPIMGWVEGPIAEAVDLFGMQEFMMATVEEPEFASALMDWTTEMEMRFALAQIAAGADIIGIGDAAASLVSPRFFQNEAAPRERKIVDAIHAAGAFARLHICGNVRGKTAAMDATGADLIDIDYLQTISEARESIRAKTCLCGNLNPVTQILGSTPEQIRADFAECYRQSGMAYVVAPGCEVPPETPDANISAMMKAATMAAE